MRMAFRSQKTSILKKMPDFIREYKDVDFSTIMINYSCIGFFISLGDKIIPGIAWQPDRPSGRAAGPFNR
jgi:hypothetical protein